MNFLHYRCKNCLRVAYLFSRRPPGNPPPGFCSRFFQCAGFVGWIKLPVGESISAGERECHLPQWALAASFPRSFLFSRSSSREEPLHDTWICRRRRIHLLRLEISINSYKSAVPHAFNWFLFFLLITLLPSFIFTGCHAFSQRYFIGLTAGIGRRLCLLCSVNQRGRRCYFTSFHRTPFYHKHSASW